MSHDSTMEEQLEIRPIYITIGGRTRESQNAKGLFRGDEFIGIVSPHYTVGVYTASCPTPERKLTVAVSDDNDDGAVIAESSVTVSPSGVDEDDATAAVLLVAAKADSGEGWPQLGG